MLRRKEAELPLGSGDNDGPKDISLKNEIISVIGPIKPLRLIAYSVIFSLFAILLAYYEKVYMNQVRPFSIKFLYFSSWSLLTLGLCFFPLVAFFPSIENNKIFRAWMIFVLVITVIIEFISNSLTNPRAQEIVEFANTDILVACIMCWATPLMAQAAHSAGKSGDADASMMKFVGHVAPFAQVVSGVIKFVIPEYEDYAELGMIIVLFITGGIIGVVDSRKQTPVRGSFGYVMVFIIGQLVIDAIGILFADMVKTNYEAFTLIMFLIGFQVTMSIIRALAASCARGAFTEDDAVAGFTFLPDVCESLFTLFMVSNLTRTWLEVFLVLSIMLLHSLFLDAAAVSAFRHWLGVAKGRHEGMANLILPLQSIQISYLSSVHRFLACLLSSLIALLVFFAHAVTPGDYCVIGCSRSLSSNAFLFICVAKVFIALFALYVQRAQLKVASGGLVRVIRDAKGHVSRWLPFFAVAGGFSCIHALHMATRIVYHSRRNAA